MKKGVQPCLAVVLVGNDPASQVYVNNKEKGCETCGFRSLKYTLPAETTQEELLKLVEELNNDTSVNGILVQLPLPKHIKEDAVIAAISPEKDVDGFKAENAGKLMLGEDCTVACTPYGVIKMLKSENIELKGKNAVVVGRSNIVGKPMAMLLLKEKMPPNPV